MFEDPEDPYVLTVGEGAAEAPLVGGCLTLLCASIGTPYEVQTDGCVVMVEDLNTEPYLVDTALNHLIRAGKLDNAAGFVFGTDVNLNSQTMPEEPESTLSIEEMLDELIAPLGIPAIANVPVGHGKHMATMPLGATVRLDGGAKTLEVIEAAVSPATDQQPRRGAGMRFRSALTMAGLLAATVVLAVAVARRPARRTRSRPTSVLKIGWAQNPATLNPFVGQDEEDYTIWAINWDLLVNFSPKDLTPVPGIAESWEVSDDKKTVTFHLDPDAKWSDGKPITSADVKYSLEVLGGNGALFTSYTDNVTSIETPDDHTVVIHTKRPDARIVGGLFIYILPKHIWGKVPVERPDRAPTSRSFRWSAAAPSSSPSSSRTAS